MREGEEEELPLADDVSDAPADDDACFTHHRVTHPTAVPDNVWRIHGRDYDLTSFVDEHPGGALFILMGKGLDCTHFFEFFTEQLSCAFVLLLELQGSCKSALQVLGPVYLLALELRFLMHLK